MQSINNIIKRTAGYFLFGVAFALTSCTDVVDKRDLGNVVDEVVWNDPNLIKNYFNNTMSAGLPGGESRLLGHADECFQNNAGIAVLNDGLTASVVDGGGTWSNLDRWPYETLRKINRFLDHAEYDNFVTNMPMTSKLAKSEKEDMVGQMLVLRAYHYFDLMRTYGGVPLLIHEQPASNEFSDMYSSRAKTSECFAQIVSDLNAAIALPDASFPLKRNDGHIGKGVAYALKGRVLLYYASPQFVAPRGGAKPAGTKSEAERWKEAYDACSEAYNKLKGDFGLYAPDGGTKEQVMDNYYKMLVTDKMNKEMIWVRKHESQVFNFGQDRDFRPSSSGGNGISPTWEMVSAFSNADGTPFTSVKVNQNNTQGGMGDIVEGTSKRPNETPAPDGSPINKSVFWLDREPRFYAFIGYNGCEWPLIRKSQNDFPGDINRATEQMKHEWIFCWGNYTDVFPFDKGKFEFSGGAGFCIRKFVSADRNYDLPGANVLNQCSTDWPLFRFAEVVLNYAEAAAKHPGHTQEAYDMLDAIRKRAGIPAANGYGLGRKTGDALILDILNERKIELFLESQRYYDARRWRLYSDALAGFKLNGTLRHCIQTWLKGIDPANAPSKQEMVAKIQTILDAGGIDNPPQMSGGVDVDPGRAAYFNVFFHVTMMHNNLPISYNPDRQDFLRIAYITHIQKNPTIEQTMGWTDDRGPGTFNPWE